MNMYFLDATKQDVCIDLFFSEDMDWNTFPYKTFPILTLDNDMYTIEMFNVTFDMTHGPRQYRIMVAPKGYIFLYNATITCTTMAYPGTYFYSINGRPFKKEDYGIQESLVWFVIEAPDMSDAETRIINSLSKASGALSSITTLPILQEVKKSGMFMFLMGGAQITTCAVLVNTIPSQNLYEGVRFWGMFVFFDVPPW
jgi:hypothetical protein